MTWYTDPDWWSAIGQWVGGIGTIFAVVVAMRQIRETREMQYELLKPEIDLYPNRNDLQIMYDDEDQEEISYETLIDFLLSHPLTITATNTKQVPVTINYIDISRFTLHRPQKSSRWGGSLPFVNWMRYIRAKRRLSRKDYFSYHTGIAEDTIVLKPGEYHHKWIELDTYKRFIEEDGVVLVQVSYYYTNTKKSVYILLIDPDYRDLDPYDRVLETSKNRKYIVKKYFKLLSKIKKRKAKVGS